MYLLAVKSSGFLAETRILLAMLVASKKVGHVLNNKVRGKKVGHVRDKKVGHVRDEKVGHVRGTKVGHVPSKRIGYVCVSTICAATSILL